MILVKENDQISELIKEIEKTYFKLCNVQVTIRTLKNSVNAILPNWYPVSPLIKNGDELFAFTGEPALMISSPKVPRHPFQFPTNFLNDAKSCCGSMKNYDSGFSSHMNIRRLPRHNELKSPESHVPRSDDMSETFSLKPQHCDIVENCDMKERMGPVKTCGSKRNIESVNKEPKRKKIKKVQKSKKVESNENEQDNMGSLGECEGYLGKCEDFVGTNETSQNVDEKINDKFGKKTLKKKPLKLQKKSSNPGKGNVKDSSIVGECSDEHREMSENKKTDEIEDKDGTHEQNRKDPEKNVESLLTNRSVKQNTVKTKHTLSKVSGKLRKRSSSSDESSWESDDNKGKKKIENSSLVKDKKISNPPSKRSEKSSSESSSEEKLDNVPNNVAGIQDNEDISDSDEDNVPQVIKGNDKDSEVIKGNDKDSEVIKGIDQDNEDSSDSDEDSVPNGVPRVTKGIDKDNKDSEVIKGIDKDSSDSDEDGVPQVTKGIDKDSEVTKGIDQDNEDSSGSDEDSVSNGVPQVTKGIDKDNSDSDVHDNIEEPQTEDNEGKRSYVKDEREDDMTSEHTGGEMAQEQIEMKTQNDKMSVEENNERDDQNMEETSFEKYETKGNSDERLEEVKNDKTTDDLSSISSGETYLKLLKLPKKTHFIDIRLSDNSDILTEDQPSLNSDYESSWSSDDSQDDDQNNKNKQSGKTKQDDQKPQNPGISKSKVNVEKNNTEKKLRKQNEKNGEKTLRKGSKNTKSSEQMHEKKEMKVSCGETMKSSQSSKKKIDKTTKNDNSDNSDDSISLKKPFTQIEMKMKVKADNTVNKEGENSESTRSKYGNIPQQQIPKTPLRVPKTPLNVPKTPLNVPKTPLRVPKTPLRVPKTPLRVPKTPLTVLKTPLTVPKTPQTVPKTPQTVPKTPQTVPKTPQKIKEISQNFPKTPLKIHNTPNINESSEKVPKTPQKITKVPKTPQKITKVPPLPQTPKTKHSRNEDKSTIKVASWLLANNVSGVYTDAPMTRGRVLKNKSTTEQVNKAKHDSKETKSRIESKDDKSGETSKKVTTQKRKLDSKEEQEIPSNKNNRKKRKQKQKNNKESKNNEDVTEKNVTDKTDVETTAHSQDDNIKRKSTPLTLPKKSKGLSALFSDDDASMKTLPEQKNQKKQPWFLQKSTPTGFLSQSINRKSGCSTGKRRAKKIKSSQQTAELNDKEEELLLNGGLNLDTLLNDESIKW